MQIAPDSQAADPGSGLQSRHLNNEISGNSGKTAGIVAVLPIAEPSAAQDFREECDAAR